MATSVEAPRRAPGPRGRLLLGHIRDLERDALGFLMGAVREHGDVVRLRFAWLELYLVTRPRHVQQVPGGIVFVVTDPDGEIV